MQLEIADPHAVVVHEPTDFYVGAHQRLATVFVGVKDAGLICTAQRGEHYEMAGDGGRPR